MQISRFAHRQTAKRRAQQSRLNAFEQLEPRRLLAANVAPVVASPISDLTLQEGVPFTFDLQPTGAAVLGFDVGGVDIRVTDNYFASSVNFLEAWEDVTFTGNTILNDNPYRVAQISKLSSNGTLKDFTWDDNTYITDTSRPFIFNGSAKTWDQWRQQTGLDGASSLTSSVDGTEITIRPNQYEPGRGHAVVYNWDRLDSVDLDLSSVVDIGAGYEIYNVLDLQGDPVDSGIYTGAPVSIPMLDVTSPIPIGHNPVAPLVVDNEFGSFLILSEATPIAASGTEYFVSTGGSPQGDGSWNNPWDLRTALSHPSSVSPGDTISVRGGTYRGGFVSELSGTANAPIVFREMPGEEVIIDLNNGSPLLSEVISVEGQYTHYQGFEVFSSDLASRVTFNSGSWPADINRGNINVFGDHVKLINWEIHDLNKGLGFWSRADGGEVYGSLIYNNGWSGPDREHGHGIYSQNEDITRRFTDNMLFNQFRHGIKIYGSDAASLKNYVLEGNISFNNGAAATEGFTGAWQYLIGGGTLATNITVNENFAYVSRRPFQDPNDTLSYSASQTNGQSLPQWLTFYGDEGFFVGTPSQADVGTIEINLTATDRSGASVTEIFDLTVQPRNQSPTVAAAIPNVSFYRNESFDIDVSSNFIDQEDGTQLSYSIRSRSGAALPNWINIDTDTGVISGTAVDAGTIALEVTAFDSLGRFVSDVLNLTVDQQTINLADVRADIAGDDFVTLDGNASYTLSITNLGSVTAQNVTVSTTLSSGTIASASASCVEVGGNLTCSLGSLAANASTLLELVVTTTEPGPLVVQTQVTTTYSESNSSNNSDSISTFVNALPQAVADTNQVNEDSQTAVTGNLISNDLDANGTSTLTVQQVNGLQSGQPIAGDFGTLAWNASGAYSYDVDSSNPAIQRLGVGQALTDSFSYTVTDGIEMDSASITIRIDGANDFPTAGDFAVTVSKEGPAVTASLPADDIDNDDDAGSLHYQWLTQPSRGQWSDQGGGQFRFEPAGQFPELLSGQQVVETLTYRVSDRHGATREAQLTITVTGVGNPPPTLTISDTIVGEASNHASFTIGLSEPINGDITLTLTTADVSATAGDDYTATTAQITILAGSTAATSTFDVPISDDIDAESSETFTVSIQSVDAGTIRDSNIVGTGTITDDDIEVDSIQILDDGDTGVVFVGNWGRAVKKGHQGDFQYATASGDKTSTWKFEIAPGRYRVSATWREWANRATDAPFTIRDGLVELTTVRVDQRIRPTDLVEQNTAFQDLGTFNFANNQIAVELTNRANGLVVADAIRIERVGDVVPGPQIRVFSGNAGIINGTGIVDFGEIGIGSTLNRTLSVTNVGSSNLTLLEPINVPSGFVVTSGFSATTLPPLASTTFELQIDTSSLGTLSGEVSFAHDESANSPFRFTVEGTVIPASNVQIIDNGADGFTTQGNWGAISNKGHQSDFQYATAGDGSSQAEWTFDVLPGQYVVSATWRAWSNRGSDAPFSIFAGNSPLATINVDQRVAPNGPVDAGSTFTELGTFSMVGDQLIVMLSDASNGVVVADAVRIERIGDVVAGPEIHVTAGEVVNDETGDIDFGEVAIGTTETRTVVVSNVGTTDLVLSGPIQVPTGFTLSQGFGSSVLTPGASTTFEVQIDTSSLGSLGGEISFANNDFDENPFNFTIRAAIVPLPDIQILDNTDAGFASSGSWTNVGRNGHIGGFAYANSGTGLNAASWTFDITPGQYRVFATWRQHSNRADQAPFSIYDGADDLGTVSVNQQLAPGGLDDAGSTFQELGTFNIVGNQLSVVLTDAGGGLVIADAIRIERIGA